MTTRRRQTTNRPGRLTEMTNSPSEVDQDTKDRLETAEILALLCGGGRPIVSARAQSQPLAPVKQQQIGRLPLPSISPSPSPATVATQPIRPVIVAKVALPPVARAIPSTTATRPSTPAKTITRAAVERKRKRSKTTPDQLSILMEEFNRDPMPSATVRQALAARLDMAPRSVQVWFQNMRAKYKKTNMGSAPGEGKQCDTTNSITRSPSTHDTETDGPVMKRQRLGSDDDDDEAEKTNMDIQPSQSPTRRACSASLAQATQPLHKVSAKTEQTQPAAKIATCPNPAISTALSTPGASSCIATSRSSLAAGKIPLPLIHHGHLGQAIFGVPLQYIPQSYHCDQLKRAMPTIAVLSAGPVQQQMTA